MALASGGTIYALTFDPASTESDLQALDPSGRLIWQRPFKVSLETAGRCRCLAVSVAGGVYTADGDVVQAYDPAGTLIWSKTKADGVQTMAERADGSLLVAGRSRLDALSPAGAPLWSASLGTRVQSAFSPSLVADNAGTSYVGTTDGHVLVIGADGKRLARLNAGANHSGVAASLFLDSSGRLVVNGADGVLRVFTASS